MTKLSKKIAAIFMILIALAHSAEAEIYKWVDERGRVHYGEEKPESATGEDISGELKALENNIQLDAMDLDLSSSSSSSNTDVQITVEIELFSYSLDKSTKKKIQKHVEKIYQMYVGWFGWPPEAPRPVVIKIFGKYSEFEQYQLSLDKTSVTNRSHYSGRYREVVMLGTEFTGATLGVLYHEVSHAIMHMRFRGSPNWVNEGLAEVFEASTLSRGGLKIGHQPAWKQIVKHKLDEGSLLHAKEYFAISNSQWSNESSNVERSYYMIGWSMMRFLIDSPEGIEVLNKVLEKTPQQKYWSKRNLATRIDEHYPGGLRKFDAHWRRWISQS